LPRVPDVVMNIPSITGNQGGGPSLRETVGVADGIPLLVYSGGMTPARGVGTIIEALPSLPGVHLAIVAVPAKVTPFVQSLLDRASALGVGDRVHIAPPVASEHVVGYLSSATIGVHPMVHFPSHDMALPNKLFEYLHARIPVVVSDCKVMADFVRTHGHGEVFVAEDPQDLAAQVRKVLDDLPHYQGALSGDQELFTLLTWATQEKVLWSVYRDLLGEDALPLDQPVVDLPLDDLTLVPGRRRVGPPVVGFGPANMAGQAWEWAKALERSFPEIKTEVVAVDRGMALIFPADVIVPQAKWARDTAWQATFGEHVLSRWSHVLLEAGRPIVGLAHGKDFEGDAAVLGQSGLTVGLLFHGSEVRDPRRHALRHQWSPYANPNEELTARLQLGTDALLPKARAFNGPVFVSTPDLLTDLPDATWLPVVVDVAAWSSDRPVLEREVPVVLHAPSRAAIKGTAFVEAAVAPLVAEGLIEYRLLEGIPPDQMPAAVADADVVLDQFALGSYGVLAAQGMAAGRVVIGHVVDEVRKHVLTATGETLPIIEADPETLTEVLRGVLSDRLSAQAMAAQGPPFVAAVHSGDLAAGILAETLGIGAHA
ncbi:MAG: glycosyltransferase, partial [Dermatophilaceae bacterium]